MFAAARKFVVAAVGLALVVGVIDSDTGDAIVAVATAILTYAIPNAS